MDTGNIGSIKVKIIILGQDLSLVIGELKDLIDKILHGKKDKVKVIVAGHAHVKK